MNRKSARYALQRHRVIRILLGPTGRAFITLLFVLLVGIIFHADGAFLKFGTHRDTLRQISVYGILACGMTVVILTGGIDLSVGSILGLTAVCFSLLCIDFALPAWIAILFCIGIGAVCGSVSGVLVTWCHVQPFIATLSVMVFVRGMAKYISGGRKIAAAIQNSDGSWQYVEVPHIFNVIDSRILNGSLAMVTVIFAVCFGIVWIAVAKHRWGRQLIALGGNENAARLSGIPVRTAKIMAYVTSGMLSAVAGICHAAQEQQGDPEAGNSYELTIIAMVAIGGTSLSGGRGGIGLTLLGILTIGYLEKILSINAVPEAARLMATGAIIVLAVLSQARRR